MDIKNIDHIISKSILAYEKQHLMKHPKISTGMHDTQQEPQQTSPDYPFKNIVFEGGGARGVAYGGTLLIMEERGILKKLERYAGASAGALTALLLSIGYTASDVFDILIKFDFNDLLDDSWGISVDLYRVYKQYGYYKGDYLQEYVRKLIEDKTNIHRITFQKLYELTKKDLILVTTNVSKDRTMYLSRYTTPDMPVDLGVRASMSIPFMFKPVIYNGDYLCDGGVSNNYPINIFDGNYPNDDFDSLFKKSNPETIGLKLMGDDETRDARIFQNPQTIKNISTYGTAILTHILNRIERSAVKVGYYERTLVVPTGNLETANFALTRETKLNAIKCAKQMANVELDYFQQNGKFSTNPRIFTPMSRINPLIKPALKPKTPTKIEFDAIII